VTRTVDADERQNGPCCPYRLLTGRARHGKKEAYRRDIERQRPVREVPLDVLRTLSGWSDVAPKLRFGHVELSPELFQALQEYILAVSDSDQAPEPLANITDAVVNDKPLKPATVGTARLGFL